MVREVLMKDSSDENDGRCFIISCRSSTGSFSSFESEEPWSVGSDGTMAAGAHEWAANGDSLVCSVDIVKSN